MESGEREKPQYLGPSWVACVRLGPGRQSHFMSIKLTVRAVFGAPRITHRWDELGPQGREGVSLYEPGKESIC